jgi:hypothetical protein
LREELKEAGAPDPEWLLQLQEDSDFSDFSDDDVFSSTNSEEDNRTSGAAALQASAEENSTTHWPSDLATHKSWGLGCFQYFCRW